MKERGELRRPGMVPPEGQAAVAAALISTGSPKSGEAAWPLVLRPPLSPVQRPAERTLPGVARRRGTPDCVDELLRGAREASISTHGGSLAIAAAAATAAAVSAAIDGKSPRGILEAAERAATLAESRWPGHDAPAFATALRAVHDGLASLPVLRPADVATRWFPNQPPTIVPLALGSPPSSSLRKRPFCWRRTSAATAIR